MAALDDLSSQANLMHLNQIQNIELSKDFEEYMRREKEREGPPGAYSDVMNIGSDSQVDQLPEGPLARGAK